MKATHVCHRDEAGQGDPAGGTIVLGGTGTFLAGSGFAWHATREACYSEFAERVLVLEYDLLTQRPGEVFKLIYDFLGEALSQFA